MNDQHLIETLPEAFHGERIDRVVSAIAGISRSLAKELIVGCKVVVDGRPITTASRKVAAGMVLTIELPPPVRYRFGIRCGHERRRRECAAVSKTRG